MNYLEKAFTLYKKDRNTYTAKHFVKAYANFIKTGEKPPYYVGLIDELVSAIVTYFTPEEAAELIDNYPTEFDALLLD